MTKALPPRVRLTEVGPRDGLQNEKRIVPTSVKAAFVRALIGAGHTDIEVTSFVRPDVVPQLADAEALFARLGPPPDGVTYGALVPNRIGLERALGAPVGKVSVFTAASETFNRRNVNASIEESIRRFRPVVDGARKAGLRIRGYVSTAFVCPYEGRVPPERVAAVVERLFDLGCDEVSLGDTIGAATPPEVTRLLDLLLEVVEPSRLVCHFHDTRGTAVANLMEALRHGIEAFDAASGGVGGCPFAPLAAGNLATEDAVYLLDRLGIEHGIELDRQREASRAVAPYLGHPLAGRVLHAPTFPPPQDLP
ncbi:MAG: hydroxymethylglutaryl-CoA lyase [Planctomycetota bacterium]